MLRKPLTHESLPFFSVKSAKAVPKAIFVRAFRVVRGQDFKQKTNHKKHQRHETIQNKNLNNARQKSHAPQAADSRISTFLQREKRKDKFKNNLCSCLSCGWWSRSKTKDQPQKAPKTRNYSKQKSKQCTAKISCPVNR